MFEHMFQTLESKVIYCFYWKSHVMSSWLHLFSYLKFKSEPANELRFRRAHVSVACLGRFLDCRMINLDIESKKDLGSFVISDQE